VPETFTQTTWSDGPGGGTPITAAQLNRIEAGVESMDDRVTATENPPVHVVGNAGSSLTLDASSASGWVKTLTLNSPNCTLTLTGTVASSVTTLELVLTQDGTGNRSLTWPASVKWAGGTPALSTAAGAVDRVVVTTYNNGTTWYADLVGKGYA
jgi:hypothetical protein